MIKIRLHQKQKNKKQNKTKSTNQINLMKDKCCFSDQALHTTYNNFHIIWANKKLIKPKHQLHHCGQVSLCVLPHPLYQKVLYSLSLASIMQTAHNTLSPTQTPHRMKFHLSAATGIGPNTPPKTFARLTNEVAEFFTQVGNNSIVNRSNILKEIQELKKDISSSPI